MCELRGNEKLGSGGGAYSKFADGDAGTEASPVDVKMQEQEREADQTHDNEHIQQVQERQRQVEARFGSMCGEHHAPLNHLHVNMSDLFRPTSESRSSAEAPIALTFNGTDVFAGIKALAELGLEEVDLEKLPGWMTGEKSVSSLDV